ncbi:MAG TPA: hypothetical protein VJ375_07990 [Gaiellaceae bacterium]|nr:hypothetical protein [Gaiellaceae bacterium]
MSVGQVTCVYHAYEADQLVATGRLTFNSLPRVGEEVRLNGRPHVIRSVEFGAGEHVLQLHPK